MFILPLLGNLLGAVIVAHRVCQTIMPVSFLLHQNHTVLHSCT
jgi:hypothetical protein